MSPMLFVPAGSAGRVRTSTSPMLLVPAGTAAARLTEPSTVIDPPLSVTGTGEVLSIAKPNVGIPVPVVMARLVVPLAEIAAMWVLAPASNAMAMPGATGVLDVVAVTPELPNATYAVTEPRFWTRAVLSVDPKATLADAVETLRVAFPVGVNASSVAVPPPPKEVIGSPVAGS